MAPFKSIPCWRNGTVGWGSCSMTSTSARIIEMRSMAVVVGMEQNMANDFIVLLVRVARAAGM